jgi:hypothetical protein
MPCSPNSPTTIRIPDERRPWSIRSSDPRILNALLNALPRDPHEHVRRLAGSARQA